MVTYGLLNLLHVALALISGVGFALRGFVRLVLQRPLAHPLIRLGPHLIDTLLLATGIGLWTVLGLAPWAAGWFGMKLILIVVYIVLGIAAFRIDDRGRAVLVYLAALGVFIAIAWLAVFKPM